MASRFFAGEDFVDKFLAARRADAAGRALAAAFHGTELHRETRHHHHIDRVVEDDKAAMADQTVLGGKGFVIERRIEQRWREIGAERAAALHSAYRAARSRAATDSLRRSRQASGRRPSRTGRQNGHCRRSATASSRATGPCRNRRRFRAVRENQRRGRKRQHVVDDGRLVEQAVDRRQRRLGAHHAAAAFKAFEQGGFLAADIGAGADAQFNVEGMARAEMSGPR